MQRRVLGGAPVSPRTTSTTVLRLLRDGDTLKITPLDRLGRSEVVP
jgi:hypothetical protein